MWLIRGLQKKAERKAVVMVINYLTSANTMWQSKDVEQAVAGIKSKFSELGVL